MKFQLQKNDLGLLAIKDLDDDTGLIISATHPSHQAGLTPAQAHLLEAAPGMYKALKALLKPYAIPLNASYPGYPKYWVDVIKALAKAEGK